MSNPTVAERRHLQIYPKSFQDSTGNGYGDLAGVTRRLDYLQELGVDAIWLTPVYVSPQVDSGYDVADYCAIDPAYGTMADFEQLVAAAHRRGIRIVMDMVFNHTSTEHPWFKAAQDRPARIASLRLARRRGTPPNNWRSNSAATHGSGTPTAASTTCTCSPPSRRISTGNTRRCAKS